MEKQVQEACLVKTNVDFEVLPISSYFSRFLFEFTDSDSKRLQGRRMDTESGEGKRVKVNQQ
jgi:hypothetical protein